MSKIDELTNKIGQELSVGDWLTVSQERIDAFAEATEDRQWIHIDHDRAAAGPFGGTIAHGFLTLSLIAGISPPFDVEGTRMGINYGLDRVRFISPVPSGSRVRTRAKLVDVTEVEGGVQLKTEVTVEIEGGTKPACVAETLTRLYF